MIRHALLCVCLMLPAIARADDSTALATRGTASVTMADIDARAESIPPDKRAGVFDSPKRIESIVSGLLLNRQLANDARKQGLADKPKVQHEILLATEAVLARHAAEAALESAKIDADALARELYLSDESSYAVPETVSVRHVLITAASRTKDEARRKAEEIRAQVSAPGADFAAIATANTEDTGTREKGGKLPDFSQGTMEKPFEEAAFALTTPGQISPLVETSFGFHVIQLIERKPARERSFEEVKPELVKKVKEEHGTRAMREYIDGLRNLPLEVNEEGLLSLRARFPVEVVAAPSVQFRADGAPAAPETD